ncbi:sodium:solute symporter family protein [Zobellia uliginosa]|uniref:sodium:solute symporter family protein n=1 Tax=Zobellia uliginosa TaxID=143224 RepID=UPI0026E3DB15|nr:sodium:solute symporter family protein [Zobellia uliginosa]MDO6516519.1 sodium:solute symporter family protein [Zobellia uliginosa]
MTLQSIDWLIIASFFAISMLIGIVVSKRAGSNTSEFFLSGRSMPWWLLGVSMVATTFSADTPNLVADIVRNNGVSGNWVWWAFLLTGMLTVFLYAKLWRRSKVLTDLEFYELRYSGKEAAFLRGFRALYLGVFFNIIIMATVSLAAIKIGWILLGLTPLQTLLIASIVTVVYSSLGGLKGVLITDFFQFFIAIIGSVWATIVIVDIPEIGGLENLLTHENVKDKLSILPDFSDMDTLIVVFIIPIAVQWWSVWYPGAEPGGGGYIAQRMLSAKDEKNAVWATLFFNVVHYAIRPWPWIIIALASLIVFPEVSDLAKAFPHVDANIVRDDLSYPAMLTYLPSGLLGLVLASLIAAFMSTISTHLNWGSSYVVNDFYQRFIRPEASGKELVLVARISTVLLMVFAALLALVLNSALQAFNILLQIGAGTGLLFILRWFWYRINAWSEITAMVVSFLASLYFQLIHENIGFSEIPPSQELIMVILITTIAWVSVTLMTQPSNEETLKSFYRLIKPGAGWNKISTMVKNESTEDSLNSEEWDIPVAILCMVVGSMTVFSILFAIGYIIYGDFKLGAIMSSLGLLGIWSLMMLWKKLKMD